MIHYLLRRPAMVRAVQEVGMNAQLELRIGSDGAQCRRGMGHKESRFDAGCPAYLDAVLDAPFRRPIEVKCKCRRHSVHLWSPGEPPPAYRRAGTIDKATGREKARFPPGSISRAIASAAFD